jgi:phosphoglycolate phosphatase
MIAGGYSAVVFDLDGTLADTAADVQQALARALASEGLPPIDVAATRLMIGGGPRMLVERALHRLGMPIREPLAERLTHAFHAEYLIQKNKLSSLFDGVESSLRQMHAAGTRLGLCSNKPDDVPFARQGFRPGHALRRGAGLRPWIAEKTRSGASSADYRTPRSNAGRHTLRVVTARNAGVQVMLVDYGYTLRAASQLGADAVISSLAELVRPGYLARSA